MIRRNNSSGKKQPRPEGRICVHISANPQAVHIYGVSPHTKPISCRLSVRPSIIDITRSVNTYCCTATALEKHSCRPSTSTSQRPLRLGLTKPSSRRYACFPRLEHPSLHLFACMWSNVSTKEEVKVKLLEIDVDRHQLPDPNIYIYKIGIYA